MQVSLDLGQAYRFSPEDFPFNDARDAANGQQHEPLQLIIDSLPACGSLLLNGQPVSAGQAIDFADIAAGRLHYLPGADGQASFDFRVRDNGGLPDADTSDTQRFTLTQGTLTIPENPNCDNEVPGGAGNDILLGDSGGTQTTLQPGQNYNIVLLIDTSGSMAAPSGDAGASRIELVREALFNLAPQLTGHDGVINLAVIGFASHVTLQLSLAGLDDASLDQWLADLASLGPEHFDYSAGTNYQAGFEAATAWFAQQPTQGHENFTYLLTDGNPTQYYAPYTGNLAGGGPSVSAETLQHTIDAFAPLAAISTVHAIGMGQGVSAGQLAYFDNSQATGERGMWLADSDGIPRWVSGPAGEATIIERAEDLQAALQPGRPVSEPVAVGNDWISGGAGNDILFGDVINTDRLPWGVDGNPQRPDHLPDGSGLAALERSSACARARHPPPRNCTTTSSSTTANCIWRGIRGAGTICWTAAREMTCCMARVATTSCAAAPAAISCSVEPARTCSSGAKVMLAVPERPTGTASMTSTPRKGIAWTCATCCKVSMPATSTTT